jgi:hypothetical protein
LRGKKRKDKTKKLRSPILHAIAPITDVIISSV